MRPHLVHWLGHYLGADLADVLAPSWFTCVGVAGLVSLIAMLALARRRGIDPAMVASAVLWCHVAAVVAGIVVPMAIDAAGRLVTTGQLHLRWAGMTSFWGYLAGATAFAVVCRRDGRLAGSRGGVRAMSDLTVVPLGIALVFARLGCFLAGCDYGKVSSLPWAVRFPAGSPAWRDHVSAGLVPAERAASLPVHPTQLYEALLGLAMIAVGRLVARRARQPGRDQPGQAFLAAAATYAVGRLFIETLRGDAGRGIYAGLSSGQIFSLLVLLAIAGRAAAGFALARRGRLTAIAAAALVLAVLDAGEAGAQPARPPPPAAQPPMPPLEPPPPPVQAPAAEPVAPPDLLAEPPPPSPPQPAAEPIAPPDQPDLLPESPQPSVAAPGLPWRPAFSTGLLFGVATPLNRRADQVPTLAGGSLSLGYIPGRFGVWLDLDRFANNDAVHTTLIASCSFTPRITPRFTLGLRAGIGVTPVNFKDPAFRDVTGQTVRLEAVAEYTFARHWVLWVRPLAIDMLSAAELGGPITTYQVRIGAAYRFGFRGPARPAAPPAPLRPREGPPLPPPVPPLVEPDPDGGPASAATATTAEVP